MLKNNNIWMSYLNTEFGDNVNCHKNRAQKLNYNTKKKVLK